MLEQLDEIRRNIAALTNLIRSLKAERKQAIAEVQRLKTPGEPLVFFSGESGISYPTPFAPFLHELNETDDLPDHLKKILEDDIERLKAKKIVEWENTIRRLKNQLIDKCMDLAFKKGLARSFSQAKFQEGYYTDELVRIRKLEKEIRELGSFVPKSSVDWKVKNEELAPRMKEYEELKKEVGDLYDGSLTGAYFKMEDVQRLLYDRIPTDQSELLAENHQGRFTGERGMARLLSPFGLQWIRGCEAVDTITGFTSYKLFELVREGLTPHSESLQPLLPTRVSLMYVERAMWEEWLNAEDEYHRNTLTTLPPYLFYQVKQLAKGCDYELSDDCPPIPVVRHSFKIPGIPGQPIKEKTREERRTDAKKNITYLTEKIAGFGPNPWATIVFDLNEEEVESLVLIGAYYKHSDLMARLSAPEPITERDLPTTKADFSPEPGTEIQEHNPAKEEAENTDRPKTLRSVKWPTLCAKFLDFYHKEKKDSSVKDAEIIRKAKEKWRSLKQVPNRTIRNWIPK